MKQVKTRFTWVIDESKMVAIHLVRDSSEKSLISSFIQCSICVVENYQFSSKHLKLLITSRKHNEKKSKTHKHILN